MAEQDHARYAQVVVAHCSEREGHMVKHKLVLGAAALLASVGSANLAYAAVDFYWINQYPNNSNADLEAVADAGGTAAASGRFLVGNTLSYNSFGSTDYTIFKWLGTTPGTVILPGSLNHGLDNTLFWFNSKYTAPVGGVTVTFTHDDGVSLYLDGSTTAVPGLTPGSTNVVNESVHLPGGTHSYQLVYGEDDGPPAVLGAKLPAAIPEASTWAMMLAGFAGLGFAALRRARKTSVSLA
jgi:hypothetical protein